MRIHYLYFFLVFSCFINAAQAQYDGSFQVALPVSPNAASLFKAVDRPIGSFTGTIPINIPLYTLSIGSLQVPVSLNYNNGGIKVEEVASWAGLGWNLSTGGQITREMRGVPDENASRRGFITPNPPDSLKPGQFPGSNFGLNTYLVVSGNLDEEPDIFYFNFLGNSGKFYFDTLGTPHMISQQPLLIQKTIQNSDSITQFIITDAKGNQFIFGGGYAESSYSTYTSQNGYTNMPTMPSYYSTWHLKQITDMSGEHTINFTYKGTQTNLQTFSSGYMHIGSMTGSDCIAADSYGDQVQVQTIAQEYYLTSIQAGNDSLVFYSSANRPDFPGSFRLDSLRLFEKGGIMREGFHLNTSFFNYTGSYNVYTNRLALNNLSEFGAGSTDSILYQFTYNTGVSLPSRLSNGMDYWGYYNGKDINSSLLPNNVYANGIFITPVTNLGDRRSSGNYAAAFTLTRITYPTGGYRSFDYEGNQALLEFGSQVLPDANYFQPATLTGSGLTYQGASQPIFSDTFTVNSANNAVPFTFSLTGSGSGNYSVALNQVLGVTTTLLYNFNKVPAGSYEIIGNGTYQIVVTEDAACNFTAIHCNWSQLVMTSTFTSRYGAGVLAQNNNVGGIRVSAVHDFDPVSGNTLTTRYKYYLPSDTLLTSGVLITPMQVAHIGGCATRNCQYIRLTATSQYPMATEGGSYVVYPNVRTIVDGNGYTDREYSFAFDQTPQGYDAMHTFPIVPPTDNSMVRGQLVVERTYDNNGQLLRRTASMGQGIYSSEWGPPQIPYTTQDYLMSDQIALKVVGYNQCNGLPPTPGVICAACWGQYDLESLFMGIRSSQNTDYQPGGGSIISKTDLTYWTSEGYPVLQTKTEYLYNGDTVRTHYCYAFNNPADFVLGLTASQNTWRTLLGSLHYMQPIEVTSTKTPAGSVSPAFVQGVKYNFAYYYGSKPHIASQITYTSRTDSVTMNLSVYDTYGNLAEQYKTGDKRDVLLWGYNGQYPVARVIGSDYNTVLALVNNATVQNPASDQALRDEINKIRTGLASGAAQVTTYTYAPGMGITSQTDPAGTTSFFEYDAHGRLMLFRDMHNNIIKKFDYHYQGQ